MVFSFPWLLMAVIEKTKIKLATVFLSKPMEFESKANESLNKLHMQNLMHRIHPRKTSLYSL